MAPERDTIIHINITIIIILKYINGGGSHVLKEGLKKAPKAHQSQVLQGAPVWVVQESEGAIGALKVGLEDAALHTLLQVGATPPSTSTAAGVAGYLVVYWSTSRRSTSWATGRWRSSRGTISIIIMGTAARGTVNFVFFSLIVLVVIVATAAGGVCRCRVQGITAGRDATSISSAGSIKRRTTVSGSLARSWQTFRWACVTFPRSIPGNWNRTAGGGGGRGGGGGGGLNPLPTTSSS